MVTKVHFISGLPRSGSTLLSALLRQNPRFVAGVTGPLAGLSSILLERMGNSEFSVFFDEQRKAAMLRGLFDSYYGQVRVDQVVFDTNRFWTGRIAVVSHLFPAMRMICCVRDVGWILDSIERLRARNPLEVSKLIGRAASATVYSRADFLMNAQRGLVGLAWSCLRGAWYSDEARRLIVLPYESLVRRPQRTLHRLYEELGEEPFEHDINNVRYDEPDYDERLGMPGLHTVRPQVRYEERKPCIPPDLFDKYAKTNFWAAPELNTRGVTVL